MVAARTCASSLGDRSHRRGRQHSATKWGRVGPAMRPHPPPGTGNDEPQPIAGLLPPLPADISDSANKKRAGSRVSAEPVVPGWVFDFYSGLARGPSRAHEMSRAATPVALPLEPGFEITCDMRQPPCQCTAWASHLHTEYRTPQHHITSHHMARPCIMPPPGGPGADTASSAGRRARRRPRTPCRLTCAREERRGEERRGRGVRSVSLWGRFGELNHK